MGKTPTRRTALPGSPRSRREHSIEEMGKLAKLRHGKCLSAEYKVYERSCCGSVSEHSSRRFAEARGALRAQAIKTLPLNSS